MNETSLDSKINNSIPKTSETIGFKVPELPVPRKRVLKSARTLSISPIENIPVNPRRSLRLSLKNVDVSNENSYTVCESLNNCDTTLSDVDQSLVYIKRQSIVRFESKSNTTQLANTSQKNIQHNEIVKNDIFELNENFDRSNGRRRLPTKIAEKSYKIDINKNNLNKRKNRGKIVKSGINNTVVGKRMLTKSG